MSILGVTDRPPTWAVIAFEAGKTLVKQAAAGGSDAKIVYNLAGQLYLSASGWLLLSVPNALVRGVFAAMNEPGIELPPGPNGEPFNAHISVLRPEEIDLIGGAEKITERGKSFAYTLGRIYEVEPPRWPGVSKVWYVKAHSPALQEFRRSYGLSGLPNNGKWEFHITTAIRRRGVLGRTETSKGQLA